MTETSILVAIHDAVVVTGRALMWRNNTGGKGRMRWGLGLGGADLIGILREGPRRGHFFALEVKTKSGRMSAQQVAWHRAVTDAGAFVRCVRSVDEALAALEEATR